MREAGHQGVLRRHRRHGRIASTQRAGLIAQLANLDPHPESVPINDLVQVEGTPLAGAASRSTRSNSCAPSRWRASPCRSAACGCRPAAARWADAVQALCFLAGANSIFYGDKLLTTGNPDADADHALLCDSSASPTA